MANLNEGALAEAHEDLLYWDAVYRRSKGLFWTCDEQCKRNKRELDEKREVFNDINLDYQKGVAEAKSELGLFSMDGVSETRDLFWSKVAGGKQFAKRATMMDALFYGVGPFRRDEGLVAIIAKVAFRFVVNLTMGLFIAVVQFLFSIWQVIWSYQPDPVSTFAFFAMAALGAVSLLVAWFLGIAAVGVAGAYAVVKVAENAQIEAGHHGQTRSTMNRGYFMHHQQQAHSHQQERQRRHSYQSRHSQNFHQRRPSQQPQSSNFDHID